MRSWLRGKCHLFAGFPSDVSWRKVELTRIDFAKLKYANEPTWVALSRNTRSVVVGANNIATLPGPASQSISAVASELQKGKSYPPVIAVEVDDNIVVLEGHTRVTAYVLTGTNAITVLLGSSASIRNWRYA